jgi:hypothetical protein
VKLSSPAARQEASNLAKAVLLLVVAFVVACVLRFPDRERKPMHVDETTQALKLKEVLSGTYHYDPVDHHGPTLLYSTVPVMTMSGKDWTDMTESGLRLIPVLYGVALLFLLWLVRDGLPLSALAWAGLLTAVSPIMVFYSRYYIMEVLLVFYGFAGIACGWRFFVSRETGWAAGAGVCAGLMHATKETCVLHFAAAAAALFAVWLAEFFSAGVGLGIVNRKRPRPVTRWQLLAFAGSAVLTSVLIFSEFLTDWRAVADSIATYFRMTGRAGGEGHQKGFFYYAGLLWGGSYGTTVIDFPWTPGRLASLFGNSGRIFKVLGLRPDSRIMVVTEAMTMGLALLGCVFAFIVKPERHQTHQFARFMAVFSMVLFLLYSFIPYKTPWCILSAWHGLLLMAGFGAAQLIALVWFRPARIVLQVLLALGVGHLAVQSWRVTRDFAASPSNPYNYSMTSRDALDAVERIRRLAEISPEGSSLVIVQHDENGGWPLPWFLGRHFPNYQWQGGTLETGNASVLLLSGNAEETVQASLAAAGKPDELASAFARMPVSLSTSTGLTMFVRRSLWDRYTARTGWPVRSVQE